MSLLIRARVLIRLNGSRHDKTCLRSFRRCKIQTSLLNYRDKQYDTLQKANNKGADHLCGCAGWSAPLLFMHKHPKTGFLAFRPKYGTDLQIRACN